MKLFHTPITRQMQTDYLGLFQARWKLEVNKFDGCVGLELCEESRSDKYPEWYDLSRGVNLYLNRTWSLGYDTVFHDGTTFKGFRIGPLQIGWYG